MKSKGIVYLVGAGPGDIGLLTLRGAELLHRADTVLYDALVNPELLRLAPATAELIFAGKHAKDHTLTQDQINALLIEHAAEGRRVVRLKGGDPYVLGRGSEEAAACRRNKIVITTFMLTQEPALVDFVNKLTQVNKGRAYFSAADNLGGSVFVDYLRNRKKKIGQ